MMLLFFIGCASSLIGEWSGSCEFDDAQNHKQIDVLASVKRDNGYVIEGKIIFDHWDQTQYDTAMHGDHTGKYVLMKSEFKDDDDAYRFRIETERVGQFLEGTCTIRSPSSPGGLSGTIDLSR